MTKKEQEEQTLVHRGFILLPTTYITKYKGYDAKEILESFGFSFLEKLEEHSTLQLIEHPTGWSSTPINDPIMWSILSDEKGRERGRVFLNATLPQRPPCLFLNTRFDVEYDFQRAERRMVVVHVTEGNEVIYTPRVIRMPKYTDRTTRQTILDNVWERGFRWLKRHGYSDWRNPAAYWN